MDEVVWIETAHPVYHALDVRWEVDGRPVSEAGGRTYLDLEALGPGGPGRTVGVTVVDPTEFVRDPALRDSALTATRSWTVGDFSVEPEEVEVAFTGSTHTERPVGGADVVYVETTHPRDRVLEVGWTLNGRPAEAGVNDRDFHLAEAGLAPGTHTLTATVTDPADPDAPGEMLTWTVDNVGPTVSYTLSEPFATAEGPGGTTHHFMWDEFTMLLEPTDDQPGYVVAEFQMNGDGWHHYYGWPDAPPGTPFRFTPRGTNIKELIYGSLSSEGLSPQPWEPRVPGWGTHTIEIRAKDAAGNIGEVSELIVTVVPRPSG